MSHLKDLFAELASTRRQIDDLRRQEEKLIAQVQRATVFDPPRRDMQIAMGYLNGRKCLALAAENHISPAAITKILKRTLPFIYQQMQTSTPIKIFHNVDIASENNDFTEPDEI